MRYSFNIFALIAVLGFSSVAIPAIAQAEVTIQAKTDAKDTKNGGQAVETQGYHLELVAGKTDKGVHLDFSLQKGDKHAVVGNANVKAEVTMPDGKKQTVPLKYDVKEKQYTALLETKATGDFKVVVLSEIAGKKVNGRFNFKR